MKPWEKRRGRVAAGVSVSLHVAVYLALAAGGFFTLIHHYTRQDGVTGVMVYNADDLAGAGGHDAAGTDTDEGRVSQPDGRDRGPEGPESPESSDRAVAASDVASPDPDEAGADGMTYAAKTESGKGEPSVKGAAGLPGRERMRPPRRPGICTYPMPSPTSSMPFGKNYL